MRLFFSCLILAGVGIGCSSSSGTTTPANGVDGGSGGTDGGSSGSGDDGGGSTGSDGGVVQQAIVQADLSVGANGASCTLPAKSLFTLGTFPDVTKGTTAVPVGDQAMSNGGTASVSCSVIANATGFDVKLQASLTGANAGSITVQGAVTSSGMQSGLNGVVAGGTNTFAQVDCTMSYDSADMGVAAGRIWATLTCGKGVDLKASQTCQVGAQVRFENCKQQ